MVCPWEQVKHECSTGRRKIAQGRCSVRRVHADVWKPGSGERRVSIVIVSARGFSSSVTHVNGNARRVKEESLVWPYKLFNVVSA